MMNDEYPNDEFSLIMGEDNLRTFHKWKNHKEILIINDSVIKTYMVINSTVPIIFIEKPRLIRKYPRIP